MNLTKLHSEVFFLIPESMLCFKYACDVKQSNNSQTDIHLHIEKEYINTKHMENHYLGAPPLARSHNLWNKFSEQ